MKTPAPAGPRLRAAAALLPMLAVFLLMPPVITLFTGPRHVLGVPLVVAYLFAVWLALIVGAALLARQLGTAEDAAGAEGAPAAAAPPPNAMADVTAEPPSPR